MRTLSLPIVGACAAITLGVTPPMASAAPASPALNGTYQAVSNGDFARTDGVYRDLPSVISTWTIESSCTDVQTCTGRVTSDQGWTAEMYFQTQSWRLRRTLPDWQRCPDGTLSTGFQLFFFYPYSGNEFEPGSPLLVGDDTTTGRPGACGRGYPVEIRLPFRLLKLS